MATSETSAYGFIEFRLNNDPVIEMREMVMLHPLPNGGGLMSARHTQGPGSSDATNLHISYPKGVVTGEQVKNYPADFSGIHEKWQYNKNGKAFLAATGQLNINFEILNTSAKGSYFMELENGQKVSGKFVLSTL